MGRHFGPMEPGEKPPPEWELMLKGYNQILEDDRKLSDYNITPTTRLSVMMIDDDSAEEPSGAAPSGAAPSGANPSSPEESQMF
jgi:hypothetical protein